MRVSMGKILKHSMNKRNLEESKVELPETIRLQVSSEKSKDFEIFTPKLLKSNSSNSSGSDLWECRFDHKKLNSSRPSNDPISWGSDVWNYMTILEQDRILTQIEFEIENPVDDLNIEDKYIIPTKWWKAYSKFREKVQSLASNDISLNTFSKLDDSVAESLFSPSK